MDAPKPDDQILSKQGSEALQRLQEILKDPKWEKFSEKPCVMMKMDIQNRLASRGQSVVNFPMEKVYEFLGEEEALYKLNPQLKEVRALYEVKDNFRINYMNYHGIWPVANRDFVNVGKKVNNGERCLIATKVCDFPLAEEKGVVRGICYIGGYVLQKIDEASTRVIYISDVDMKGSIPGMVKKQVSKRQGQIASRIEAQMKKL